MSTKITVKEINQMINEEVAKAKKAIALRKEYDALTEEEAQIQEQLGLDEVEVGGRKSGEEWYEKDVPVAKFEKIGTHLKEMDMEDEMMDDEMGYFESKLAELGRELDARISDDMGSEEAEEEMDMDMDMGSDDDAGEEEAEEESEIMEITLDEESVDEAETVSEEDALEEEEVVEEQEGEAIVNAADQDTVNDNMEKVSNDNPMADKMYEGEEASETEEVVEESEENEGEVLSEGKSEKSNLITEGMDEASAAAVTAELARMKKLMG